MSEQQYGETGLRYLYGPLLPLTNALFAKRWFSRLLAWPSTWKRSAAGIEEFVAKWGIDLDDYQPGPYPNFAEFFTRSFRAGARPLDPDPTRLIAPADGKLLAYHGQHFSVKGFPYTARSILGYAPETGSARRSQDRARFRSSYSTLVDREHAPATALVLRLSVDDCHRYCFPASGRVVDSYQIAGKLHTVGPFSAGKIPVLVENYRVVTEMDTEHFGPLFIVEVGAMLVGRIHNHQIEVAERGQEKGYFSYGGSTMVILGEFLPDAELLERSAAGVETEVRMGAGVGSPR
jgi:phosphatidylserine decarboxylase